MINFYDCKHLFSFFDFALFKVSLRLLVRSGVAYACEDESFTFVLSFATFIENIHVWTSEGGMDGGIGKEPCKEMGKV